MENEFYSGKLNHAFARGNAPIKPNTIILGITARAKELQAQGLPLYWANWRAIRDTFDISELA